MSESQHHSSGAGGTIGAAAFGALLTIIALTGAFVIADTPRPLTEVANAIASEGFEVVPASFETVAAEQPMTQPGDDYADPALRAMFGLIG